MMVQIVARLQFNRAQNAHCNLETASLLRIESEKTREKKIKKGRERKKQG